MLLNLLKKLEVAKIRIAGFDGLSNDGMNYVNSDFFNNNKLSIKDTNNEIKKLYSNFKDKTKNKIDVKILTPTVYE